jgi:hypothetical protein
MATAPENPEFAKWTGPNPYTTLAPLRDLRIPIGSTSFGFFWMTANRKVTSTQARC